MTVRRRQWTVSLLLALGIHVFGAAALFWQKPVDGAKSAGIGGIEIALGPSGGAPGSVAAAVPEPAAEEAPPEDVPVETPPETAAMPVEPEQRIETPVETVPVAEPVPAPTPTVETVPTEQKVAKAVATPPPPPKRKPTPNKPVRTEVKLKPVAEPTPPVERPAEPTEVQKKSVDPSIAGTGGKAGATDSPNAGSSANDASAGGMAGAAADYMSLLQAWLEKHKEYPRRARSRRQQGTALLYFVMNREGDVIEYKLNKSSGYSILDREVLAMIKRAQPLPRFPDDMSKDQMELVVPVQFFIR